MRLTGASLRAMIISRGRRYIFVHIPKTGGTSLALALEARAMKDDILIGDTPKAKRRRGRVAKLNAAGRLWKHSTLADIEGVVERAEFDELFVFTLVRNPWDRMVSYYHWLRVQAFSHPAVALAKSSDFKSFILHPHTRTSMSNWPYGRYVSDGDGREHVSCFVRLEHMEQDLVPAEDHLGFSLFPLERTNASQRPPDYRSCYCDDTAETVAKGCAQDINRFGYAF